MRKGFLEIDGSIGEGGGQVLRTALTLSVLTGRPVEIRNIRAGRPNPGLQPQHLTAVHAAAAICQAELEGAALGSQTLRFIPRSQPRSGEYVFDVTEVAGRGSAGAVGLVFQTLFLPLALVPGESLVVLRGGTHVPWAPSVDYLQEVFLPTVARMGLDAEIDLVAWGFYPIGGGEARVRIRGRPGPLTPLTLTERGSARKVRGRTVVSNLPAHIPQRMADRARNLLVRAGLKADLQPLVTRGAGPGAGIFLVVEYEHIRAGFSAYGRKGVPAEQVAEEACRELLAHHESGAPVDPHLADQLLLPMALAAGTSRFVTSAITGHLLTNLTVIQAFLPVQVRVDGEVGQPGVVVLTGG
ncbi:MAG: RNA 3'-terminal phosphate cyclase [Anaerolineae bacterium]|nr:RNA 3'-terminal phosphate cyclase [Anaerolineae bacterium]MCX8068812.1 RNA 3'-terminal phosphate cyclase [Anaerolineae bacterium]MDW7992180.1 RNA 3'-terminal phosphate cyclase [Anaerolineae bacterium]